MSQLFASGAQSVGASAAVLPMNNSALISFSHFRDGKRKEACPTHWSWGDGGGLYMLYSESLYF